MFKHEVNFVQKEDLKNKNSCSQFLSINYKLTSGLFQSYHLIELFLFQRKDLNDLYMQTELQPLILGLMLLSGAHQDHRCLVFIGKFVVELWLRSELLFLVELL